MDILRDNSRIIEKELKLEPEKRTFLNQLSEDFSFANRLRLNTFEECTREILKFGGHCNNYYK